MRNLFFLLLFNSLTCLGQYDQCYYLKLSQAEIAYRLDKDYKLSAQLFEEAFAMQTCHFPSMLLMAAQTNLPIGKAKRAREFILLAVQYGSKWEDIDTTKQQWDLLGKGFEKWAFLRKSYPKLRQDYVKNIDLDVFAQVVELATLDQSVRGKPIAESAPVDSMVLAEFKSLIEEKGFPSYTSFPSDRRIYLIIIIIHALQRDALQGTNENLAYFQKLLSQQLLLGNIPPQDYKVIINSYYYAQSPSKSYFGKTGSKDILDLVNVAEVDKYRREIGLYPFADEIALSKLVTPKGYKNPDKKDYYNCTKP